MNIALILSGGIGSRLGADMPKQYLEVQGKKIITYAMENLFAHDEIDAVQIVAEEEYFPMIEKEMKCFGEFRKKFREFSAPGANRQLSILNGLRSIAEYAGTEDCVMIHDAVRPLLSEKLIMRCLQGMEGHDGVLPVLPMKDTVYLSRDGSRVSALLKRKEIYAGQAPETFRLGKYLQANEKLLPQKILEIKGSTEPAIMAEMDIVMIPGDENNYKITTRQDLERFAEMAASVRRNGGTVNEGVGVTKC